jgi:hypothetical protein
MSGSYERRKERERVAKLADAERSATKKADQAYATELRRVTVGQGQGKPGDTYYGGRRRKTKSKTKRSRTKRSTKSKRTRSRK